MGAILEARNITRGFPGVRALDGVYLCLEENQIHALCGENGAGKSTLINVLSGYFPSRSYTGEILVGRSGEELLRDHRGGRGGDRRQPQKVKTLPRAPAAENIFMGHEIARRGILDWNEMYSQTGDSIARLKLEDSVKPSRQREEFKQRPSRS